MRRTLRLGLLTLVMAVAAAGCSGGEGDGTPAPPEGSLQFVALAAPPKPVGPTAFVDDADTVLALVEGRLFRYDPWTPGSTWLERGRDLPSAKSRLVTWNDRVWYLTTDRGRLELASIALSGEQRADTRVVRGATDAHLAILAARDAVYVFGADGGFRVGFDGAYTEFPGPPDAGAVSDWQTVQVAELSDGSIVVIDDKRVRWIYEPELARWRVPSSDLGQHDIRSITVSPDGAYLIAGSPPQISLLVASNRLEPVRSELAAECRTPVLFPNDLGVVVVGCGTATLVDGTGSYTIAVPAGTSIVHGPRGRPLAIRTDTGELSLLQLT